MTEFHLYTSGARDDLLSSRTFARLRAIATRTLVVVRAARHGDTLQVTHVHGLQHVHGVAVDFNGIRLESRLLRHEIHTALTLFLLKLERDTADRATLDTLHQVLRD